MMEKPITKGRIDPTDRLKIGTWPTPEMPTWEILEKLKELIEEKHAKEYNLILTNFRESLCKFLEASIRSDIECLHKYNRPEVDLCTEPKIEECMTRLVHTAHLYNRICCLE
jgi:hypothetical protein